MTTRLRDSLRVGVLGGLLALAGTGIPAPASAADHEQSLWGAWFNNVAFNDRFGLVSDVQLRSRDDVEGPRNLLIRPGLSWYAAPGITPSIGYAYIGTYNAGRADGIEHRLWQQLVTSHTIPGGSFSQRLRLEQRFIGRPGAPDLYSDRLRWFGRAVFPIEGANGPFRNGLFIAAQNEVFLGLSNRDDLNGRVFDQNRAYLALGWRYRPGMDVEVGYLNQWINGRNGDTVNHILQVALYTNFGR